MIINPALTIHYYGLDRIDELDDLEYLEKSSERIEKYLGAPVAYKLPSKAIISGSRNLVSQIAYRRECGTLLGFKSCDLGHVVPIFKSCNIITCPICVRTAAGTKSFKVTHTKILPFQTLIGKYNLHTLPVHAIFSPAEFNQENVLKIIGLEPDMFPNELSTERLQELVYSMGSNFNVEKYKWLCSYLTRVPKSYKAYSRLIEFVWANFLSFIFHSGLIVYHPDRIDPYTHERVISPHFHIIGWVRDQRVHTIKKKTKTGFKNVRIQNFIDGRAFFNQNGFNLKSKGTLRTSDDIRRCFTYELSHTLIFERKVYRKMTEKQYSKALDNYWLTRGHEKGWPMPKDHYYSKIRLGTYWYQGLISPYNMKKIGEKQTKFVLQKCGHVHKVKGKWVQCEGLMCEIKNVKMVHIKSKRIFTLQQLHDFDIKIRHKDRDKWKVLLPEKPEYGFYLYNKVKYYNFKFREKILGENEWLTKN